MHRTVLLAILCLTSSDLFAQRSLHLQVGDPARKDREAKLVLDAITATGSGELITPREAASRLSSSRIVFVGESHTSMDFHRAQLRIIEELNRAGKKVFVGLEMYPRSEQKWLDDWCNGLLTETGFTELSHWYLNWGYHWDYYRDIFTYARDHGIRMFALNAPREVVSAVTRKGLQNLTPDETAQLAPKIDTSSEEHFALFKAFFEDETGGMHSTMSDAQARAMFASQCTWDATMGFNAVTALKDFGDDNTVMVVLIGSGHVAYGLGIQRQSAQWFEGKMASMIPVEVLDNKDRPVESVQASFADFVWGLPPEKDSLYPDLGVATVGAPGAAGRRVVSVTEESPAEAVGFRVGDVIVAMDGTTIANREVFNKLISGKRWGDAADYVVRRSAKEGTEEVRLRVAFRRHNRVPKR
jgi:uncharacterized iron-regulated protein